MSQKFVTDIILPRIKGIKNDENISDDGAAFQHWLMNLFCQNDRGIDRDRSYSLTTRDGGVDLVLFAPGDEHVYVIQAKYTSRKKVVPADQILSFAKLRKIISPEWVEKNNLSETAKEAYAEYLYCIDKGWKESWIFVTTGQIPEARLPEDSDISVYGTSELSDRHKMANSQDESIPDKVEFPVPADDFILLKEPRKTLIAVVKGNLIVDLYKRHKDALLAYNVRAFMGDRGINTNIKATAEKEGENFFYFNNGISAICNKFEMKKNLVTAEKFQIINGGQTIGSLSRAGKADNVRVLLKLVVGVGVSTEKGFNHDVIRYNNTQNAIKGSDFRSNDPVQNDIAKKFQSLKPKNSALDRGIDYRPKRGGRPQAPLGREILRLEEFARILYSYEHEPCTAIESPKHLWDVDRKYHETFGKNGYWTDEKFNEAVLAYAFHVHIRAKIRELRKDASKDETGDPKRYDYLSRLKYHILGFASIYAKHRQISSTAWKNKAEFQEIFSDFWNQQIHKTQSFKEMSENGNAARGTLSNIIRNHSIWEKTSKGFKAQLEMTISRQTR